VLDVRLGEPRGEQFEKRAVDGVAVFEGFAFGVAVEMRLVVVVIDHSEDVDYFFGFEVLSSFHARTHVVFCEIIRKEESFGLDIGLSAFVVFVGFDMFKLMNEKSFMVLGLFCEVVGLEVHAIDAFVVFDFFETYVELMVENVGEGSF
jgi:hypothetical protein